MFAAAKGNPSPIPPERLGAWIVDARKTLAWINARAGTTVQGHGLRATFASVAEELVSGGALKRMLNHATGCGRRLEFVFCQPV